MTRIFTAAGIITASLVVAGLVLGWLLLPGLSETEIKQAVARDAGRSISFAGRPRLSVWPELAIELRDVKLSNPDDMAEGLFAAAETVRLKVSGSSILRRAPEVSEVVVLRPRVNLLVDSEGRSNFAFEPREDEVEPEAMVAPVILVDGRVKYLNERSGAAFAASDVDMTLSNAGLAGPVELDGAFNWNDQRLTLAFHARSSARLTAGGSPADFTIDGPYLNAAFSGRAAIREGLELAGTLEFRAEPLADLLSWAGHASALTGNLPAFTASGALDLSRGAIRMSEAELVLGAMKAQGDVALSFAGVRPQVTGNLGLDRIDLTALAGDPADGWSESPIDLEILKVIDAEVALAVSELTWGGIAAGESRLDIALDNGALDVTLVETALYGGSASGRLTLVRSGQLAALDAELEAEGLDGSKLGTTWVRGQTDVAFDVASRGASRQELLARLRGDAHLRVSDGALTTVDVPAMFAHLKTAVAEGWTAGEGDDTPFSLLKASFEIEDGIAETEDLALDGAVAEVAGTGSIDLLSRRLALDVQPKVMAIKGEQATEELPVPVVIAGPWATPKIYPKVTGILENPARALDALRKRMLMDAAKLDLSTRNPENEDDETTATP